jgi:hypothetical protein
MSGDSGDRKGTKRKLEESLAEVANDAATSTSAQVRFFGGGGRAEFRPASAAARLSPPRASPPLTRALPSPLPNRSPAWRPSSPT